MAQPPNVSILDQFAGLEDPRVERTRRHKLLDIIAIAICATICGQGASNYQNTCPPTNPRPKTIYMKIARP